MAVYHEVTEEVIDVVLALPERPALLVSYHPLLFRPVTSLVAGKGPEGRALRLAAAAVALAVVHTNWDAVPGGAADALCGSLGIEEPVPFGPIEAGSTVKVVTFAPSESVEALVEAMADAGAGRIGRYTRCSFRTPGSGLVSRWRPVRPGGRPGRIGHRRPRGQDRDAGPRGGCGAVLAAMVSPILTRSRRST